MIYLDRPKIIKEIIRYKTKKVHTSWGIMNALFLRGKKTINLISRCQIVLMYLYFFPLGIIEIIKYTQ